MEGPIGATLGAIERLGDWLGRHRIGAFASCLASTVWFISLVLGSTTESAWSLLALSTLLWSLIAIGAGYGLSHLPRPTALREGVLRWLGQWVALVAFTLGAICLLVLAGFATFLAIRALGLIFG